MKSMPRGGDRTAAQVAALTAVTALILTACASGKPLLSNPSTARSVASTSSPTTPRTPVSTPPPRQLPASAAQTSPATVSTNPTAGNELDAVLITAGEIGMNYSQAATTPTQPLPCTPTAPPVDQQLQNVESGRVNFVDNTGHTQVSEQIYVYGGQTAAVRHQQIDEAGLACRKGTIAATPISIAGPYNVAGQLNLQHLNSAQVWALSNSQVNAELFCMRINAVVIQFSFVADATATPTVDAKRVLQTALRKVLQHA